MGCNKKGMDQMNEEIETKNGVKTDRRSFFKKCSKFAVYTPPAIYLLMHSQKEAVAGSYSGQHPSDRRRKKHRRSRDDRHDERFSNRDRDRHNKMRNGRDPYGKANRSSDRDGADNNDYNSNDYNNDYNNDSNNYNNDNSDYSNDYNNDYNES